jgi:predicted metal-dependent hydrolase
VAPALPDKGLPDLDPEARSSYTEGNMRKIGEAHTVALASGEIRCVIRRRKNQKYINLRITLEGELQVSAPYGIGIERIKDSVRKKERWIARNLEKVALSRSDTDPLKSLLIDGRSYEIGVVRNAARSRLIRIDREGARIEVHTKTPTRAHVQKVLERFLVREARTRLPPRAAQLSALTGIHFGRVYIRNQRTRWGSSSGKGNVSFNWRAIMIPPEVQDYLIIHELAHQVHLNHSKAFWKVVEQWCPEYRSANRWLRDHATLISLFR